MRTYTSKMGLEFGILGRENDTGKTGLERCDSSNQKNNTSQIGGLS